MSIVSYNAGEMEQIRMTYAGAKNMFDQIKYGMLQSVKTIRENWSGDDAEKAAEDLKAIEDQLASIEENLNEIISLIDTVQNNFGQLNY